MPEPNNLFEDEILIENELEKLYALQDKPSTKAKREIVVKELISTGIPTGAILSGIRHLHTEDLSAIKFPIIVSAARRYVVQDNEIQACHECSQGVICYRDGEGRWFALACRCQAGEEKQRAHGLARSYAAPTYTSPKNGILTKAG